MVAYIIPMPPPVAFDDEDLELMEQCGRRVAAQSRHKGDLEAAPLSGSARLRFPHASAPRFEERFVVEHEERLAAAAHAHDPEHVVRREIEEFAAVASPPRPAAAGRGNLPPFPAGRVPWIAGRAPLSSQAP
jgi:hypothetical protein